MANRVVEVFYELKDLFSGKIRKITGSYRDLEGASERASEKIVRDNRRTESSFTRLSASVGKLRTLWFSLTGLIAAGGVVAGLRRVSSQLDELGKTADRLGISANTLNAFQFAAERSGVASEKIAGAIETLQKRTGEAAQGIGEAAKAFDRLGVNVEDFIALDAEAQFRELAGLLQAVASEEERAALASQLFSKANLDVLQILNQGPAAFDAYIAKAKELNTITDENVQAAAAFEDSLRNAQEALRAPGLQFGARVITGLNLLSESAGLSANQLRNLEQAVLLAQKAFDAANRVGLSESTEQYRRLERNLNAARAELRAYALQLGKTAIAEDEARKAREQQDATNERYISGLNEVTDGFERLSERRIETINAEVAEFEAAQKRQARIAREFSDLYDDITQPDLDPEDVSLGDVFLAQRRAAAASERGEAEQAVEIARQGFDLLELLKEKGTETGGTLQFLAGQLKKVAEVAAAQDVSREQTQVDAAKRAFAELQKQADFLKANAPAAGKEYAQAFLQGARDELAGAQLPAPAVSAPARSSTPIFRDGNSFSDGTDFGTAIEREAPL